LPALLDILEEEKRTDESLSTLAKRVVNPDAAAT
jgi:ferritin-like metal-binding protein YciE